MDPINYNIDVQTPFQAALQGYQAGAGIREDQLKAQQQQLALQQQQQATKVINSLISNPNAGASDYAAATLLVPGMKDQFKQSWDMRNTDQQQTHLGEVGQYFSAVKNGRPDLATEMMRQRADAFEASGDAKQAQALRAQADVVEQHPEFARTMMGMMLSTLPGGDKVLTNLAALNTDQRAQDKAPAELRKAEADATTAETEAKYSEPKMISGLQESAAKLGLTRAQTNQAIATTKKLNVETQQALIEAQQGGDPTKRFDAEKKLRDEFTKNTTSSLDIRDNFRRIQASKPDSVGDLSLIFGYMKMLDPGSVVREGEFANAQNAAGIPDRVTNAYNRLLKGERLTTGQRKMFLSQAEKLNEVAERRIADEQKRLDPVVRSYGLKHENIFGPDAAPQSGKASVTAGPSVGAVEGGYRFKGGNPADANSWEKVK